MVHIELKPVHYKDRYIATNIKCNFDPNYHFYRGNFEVRTNHSTGFAIASAGCPEWIRPDNEVDMTGARLYIQGDTKSRDNDLLYFTIKEFLYVNSQIAVANFAINEGAFYFDDDCEELLEYEDGYQLDPPEPIDITDYDCEDDF